MTNDKLELVPAPEGARSLQGMTPVGWCGSSVMDEAIRAQLMCVAVGVGGTGGSAARMLVDLSIHLSLDERYMSMQGSYSTGIVIVGTGDSRQMMSSAQDDWDRASMLVPFWSSVCTQPRFHGGGEAYESISQPMTLSLLFDADSREQAQDAAEQLCEGFSAWHAATTSLREAMGAIRMILIEPPQGRQRAHVPLGYRSATVCRGWRQRITDPMSFLQDEQPTDVWHSSSALGVREFFTQRFEAAWHEEARALEAPHANEQEAADPVATDDAADDHVCSSRMLSLWYGEGQRRRRGSSRSRSPD